ncbi:MAG: ATP-binding cassette domain-containing protein, partial [Candidatus Cloacimonetes bacterium]|nr:ATP-binding cassette domain-containing protein [Candidatus Cloacimonadota bacterium]MCK9185538.1 ATP-binding cassette domain-containing protein [Candidatus Cloacimonadota bacterium]
MIHTRDLVKEFGSFRAVDNINLDIAKGEIFGFLGANGAGKTTTIRMLCGLLLPSSGSITVDGLDIAKHSEGVKHKIGYMSQKFSLYPDLKAIENLEFYAGIY